jgi:hypothetical protein
MQTSPAKAAVRAAPKGTKLTEEVDDGDEDARHSDDIEHGEDTRAEQCDAKEAEEADAVVNHRGQPF